MGLKTAEAGQVGYVIEATAGTAATPTLFVPLVSESMKMDIDRMESAGIIAGRRLLTSNQWAAGKRTIGGDTNHELYNRGLGPLLQAWIGTPVTTGSGTYTHTYTPGDLSAFTVQVGRTAIDGTVYPFTFSGCKAASWEIGCKAGEIVTAATTWAGMRGQAGSRVVTDGVTNTDTSLVSATAAFTAKDKHKSVSGAGIPAGARIVSVTNATTVVLSVATTATATNVSTTIGLPLAAASYTAGQTPLTFLHGSISVGGSVVSVDSATLHGDNGLVIDRLMIGDDCVKEPLEGDLRAYTGTLEVEFESLTQYERFTSGAEFALVLSFVSGTDTVTFTLNTRYDGEDPQMGGRGIVKQNLPFKSTASTTDASGFTAVLVNGDALP